MNRKTLAGDRRRRKLITILWALGLSLVVIVLIYKQYTAVLYIICTLGVTALLLVVAFSDLSKGEPHEEQLAQPGDAAGVAGRAK